MERTNLRIRQAARGLILDETGAVLLASYTTPNRTIWATPGGGIEPGETVLDALRRELIEEVGRSDLFIGELVFTRTAVFPVGEHFDGQHNRVHLIRTERFEPNPAIGWDGMRDEGVGTIRWWELDAIDAAANDPAAVDRFVPAELTTVVRSVLTSGVPKPPWEFNDEVVGG